VNPAFAALLALGSIVGHITLWSDWLTSSFTRSGSLIALRNRSSKGSRGPISAWLAVILVLTIANLLFFAFLAIDPGQPIATRLIAVIDVTAVLLWTAHAVTWVRGG
jgi:hypothetical protein